MTAPATNAKAELLATTVEHVDIAAYDARPVIDAMTWLTSSEKDSVFEKTALSVFPRLAGRLAPVTAGPVAAR